MPYRLRVTQEEVQQELARLGFTGLSDDTVAALRKDLLKVIKSDLRRCKQERKDVGASDTSSSSSSSTPHRQHTCPKRSLNINEASTPIPKTIYTKEPFFRSASRTSEEKDDSGESGYSDLESTTSGLSEAYPKKPSQSPLATGLPRGGTGQVKERRPGTTSSERIGQRRGSQKEATGSQKRSAGVPSLATATAAPAGKTTRERKAKQEKDRRGALPKYPSRPDPVNLYHYYKAHWDQHKAPGEDPHLKLRWKVRSRLFYAE